jgi:hypothetical protein
MFDDGIGWDREVHVDVPRIVHSELETHALVTLEIRYGAQRT